MLTKKLKHSFVIRSQNDEIKVKCWEKSLKSRIKLAYSVFQLFLNMSALFLDISALITKFYYAFNLIISTLFSKFYFSLDFSIIIFPICHGPYTLPYASSLLETIILNKWSFKLNRCILFPLSHEYLTLVFSLQTLIPELSNSVWQLAG